MLAYPNSIYRDNISFVASDDFKGGTLAANYFKENKCNEIFVIMPSYGKYSIVNYDMRLAGIQNHWPNGKLNIINVEIENDSFAFEKAGYSAGSEIAKQIEPDKRTGIFAPMSDQVICGLLRRFGEEKHINRKNVLFCGYDNLSESNEWNNNFTSLEYSNLDIGHRAALLLLAKIKSGGNDAPDSEILPVKLIKRG
jgi:DNA-binding LacI/PurR family transcriptional regulator